MKKIRYKENKRNERGTRKRERGRTTRSLLLPDIIRMAACGTYIYMSDLIACRNDINHTRLTYPRPFALFTSFQPPADPRGSKETVPMP